MNRTFNERVDAFWDWYPTVAADLFSAIEAGNLEAHAQRVIDFMAGTLPGLAWVFGPGEDGGHSFTVSGEGQRPIQMLADQWQSKSLAVDGWTFHAARQANPDFGEIQIQLGDLGVVSAAEFLLDSAVDHGEAKLDVAIWHPIFSQLPEEHHGQIVFLFLDEALGEFGVGASLGNIDISPIDLSHTSRLSDLPRLVREAHAVHGWQVAAPFDTYTAYEQQAQTASPRGDIIVGITCLPHEIFAFGEHGGVLPDDPLAETGASLEYLQIDGSALATGNQAAERQALEESIIEGLGRNQAGRVVGGASGVNNSYIDLLILDGQRSRGIVDDVLNRAGLGRRFSWHTFAR